MANGRRNLPPLPRLGGRRSRLPDSFKRTSIVDLARQPLGETFAEKQLKKMTRGNADLKLQAVRDASDQSLADSALEVISNAGGELRDIVLGIPLLGFHAAKKGISALVNPIDTYEAITSGEAFEDLQDTVGEFLEAVGDDYRQRYEPLFEGDIEGTLASMKDKPLSYLLDLGGALSLAGGATRAAGGALGRTSASKALKTTGARLSAIGATLDPIAPGIRGLGKAGKFVGGKISQRFPKLPLVGAESVATRTARKQGRFALVESYQDAVAQVGNELDEFTTSFGKLTDVEKQALPLHLSRLQVDDASRLTPEFNKAVNAWEEFIGGDFAREVLGIGSQEARRRAVMPVVLKKFKEGSLNLSDDVLEELTGKGLVRPGNPLTGEAADILNPEGVLDFSEEFFRQAESQLSPKELGATYFPLLDGEIAVKPGEAITRIGKRTKAVTTPFKENFTGTVVNKFLKTKDPGVLADTREVLRRFTNDLTVAKSMENLNRKLLNQVDAATGQPLLKRIFVGGKLPKNISAFDNGADAARALNAMDNVATGSLDDVYKRATGMSRNDFFAEVKRTAPKGISNQAVAKRADDIVVERLRDQGFDGYLVNKQGRGFGQFRFADEALNPFTKVDDHVVWHPTVMLDAVKKQEALSKKTLELMQSNNKMSLQEAYGSALKDVLPQTRDFYDGVKRELLELGDDVDIINTELIDKAKSSKFIQDLTRGLKPGLRGEISEKAVRETAEAYNRSTAKFFARKGVKPPTAKQMWAYQIPKASANEIQDLFAPVGNTFVRNFLDSPLNAWRTAVLNFSPRWHVNNFVGGLMLNTTAGVLNPADYMRAGRLFIHGLGKRFPSVMGPDRSKVARLLGISEKKMAQIKELESFIPNEIHAGTFARAENYTPNLLRAAENPHSKMHAFLNESAIGRKLARAATGIGDFAEASADFNSMVDGFFRNTQFLSQLRGKVRQSAKGPIKKILKSFYATDQELIDAAKAMRPEDMTRIVESVNKWLPNYLKLLSATERRFVRRIAPFYSWYKHMFGVAMMMPLNHPQRTTFISHLARLATDSNEEDFRRAGLDPEHVKLVADYLQSTVILSKDKDKIKTLSLRGINPFTTILEIPNIGAALRPELKAAIEQLTNKDLFTGREFNKTVKIGSDGIPREVYEKNLLDAAIRNVPQAELIRRMVNPEVTDRAGQVIYKRDRGLEALKFLGANISERNIEQITERAEKRKGNLAGKALRELLKRDPDKAPELLDSIMRSRQ